MKKPWVKRFNRFLAGRGFYIVLFLCVAAIGISGYLLFSANRNQNAGSAALSAARSQSVAGGAEVPAAPDPVSPDPVSPDPVSPDAPEAHAEDGADTFAAPAASPPPVQSAAPAPTETQPPATAPAAPSPASVPTAAEAGTAFVRPVTGEVALAFSTEELVYNETLRDWRTHAGIDILADPGTPVMAVSAGTVADVYEDDLLGTVIVISHANEVKSIYANLAPEPAVEPGDAVLAGDVIAAVGQTAIAESGSPAHLHFAMEKDGAAVDPAGYLAGER